MCVCGKNDASLNLQRRREASLDTLKWEINVNVKSKQINLDAQKKKKTQIGYSQIRWVKVEHLSL